MPSAEDPDRPGGEDGRGVVLQPGERLGEDVDGEHIRDERDRLLARLRYLGSASRWGFAPYLASRDGYEESVLPSGSTAGAPEEALDCVCGLYLGDPTVWFQ